MPYDSTRDLPQGVRNVLPKAAQDIWRRSFNKGWAAAHKEGKRGKERDTQGRQWAWQAVKTAGYVKDEKTGKWKLSKTAKKGVKAAAERGGQEAASLYFPSKPQKHDEATGGQET